VCEVHAYAGLLAAEERHHPRVYTRQLRLRRRRGYTNDRDRFPSKVERTFSSLFPSLFDLSAISNLKPPRRPPHRSIRAPDRGVAVYGRDADVQLLAARDGERGDLLPCCEGEGRGEGEGGGGLAAAEW